MASVKYEADAIEPDRRGAVVLRGSEPADATCNRGSTAATCNRGSRPTATSTRDPYHPSDIWSTAACAGKTERERERDRETGVLGCALHFILFYDVMCKRKEKSKGGKNGIL